MSPLHFIGEWLRELFAQVPLGVVRGVFVLLPAALFVWIMTLPESAVRAPDGPKRAGGNLRLWAAVALGVQILIYLLL